MGQELLFRDYELFSVIREQEQRLISEIKSISSESLSDNKKEETIRKIKDDYLFNVPKLIEDKIEVSKKEVEIDISQRPDAFSRDIDEGPFWIRGIKISYHIPFTGDADLFKCRPSSYTFSPPRGYIIDDELVLSFEEVESSTEKIKAKYEKEVAEIKKYLENIKKDVSDFNATLNDKIQQQLNLRLEKIQRDRDLVDSLGFPVRN